jgi:zinc transporter ZupT
MLLESSHLVEAEWGGEEESDVAWRWGAALLAGFLLPLVGQMVSEALGVEDLAKSLNGSTAPGSGRSRAEEIRYRLGFIEAKKQTELVGTVGGEEPQEKAVAEDNNDAKTAALTAAEEEARNTSNSAVFAVCFGDVFHNFTDGVFIGAAFKLCSSNSTAWAVAGGAAAHEVTRLWLLPSPDDGQAQ